MTEPVPPEDKPVEEKAPQSAEPKEEPKEEPKPEPEPTLLDAWRQVKNADKPLSQLTFEKGSFMASSVIGGGIATGLLGTAFYMATTAKTESMTSHEKTLHHTEAVGLSLLAVPFIGVCILHAWFRKRVSAELERRRNIPPPEQAPKP